jgi:hypothetical protein
MFRRSWIWFGKLVSDEGFCLSYGNKTIIYEDERGKFQFGWEDGFLFPAPHQLSGDPVTLNEDKTEQIMQRIVRGIESEGHLVKIFARP